ncbi:MAG: NAD(P)H-hydrate dehydratase [Alloprevotella sp.]|nr:NAD(P)H-hydrate dehydratase [Alloprevotella sp.]
MKIFNAEQLRELDEYTVSHDDVASLELMERAATCVAEEVKARWTPEWRVIVLAGPGNNGGDALAVARLLADAGYGVETYLFNTRGKLSEDCEANRLRLLQMPQVALTEVTSKFSAPKIEPRTLIVDGLFGTGLTRTLSSGFADLVRFVNAVSAKVVSIDMPSGLMTEDNALNVPSQIVHADLTVTFQAPKLAQLLTDCAEFVGELVVADIGLSRTKMAETDASFYLTEREEMRELLKPRATFGHKGTFGHGLLVAGKRGMAGAAILAGRAFLRAGAGKITIHTPSANNDILQMALPEAVLSLDANADHFSAPVPSGAYQAVAIGPGLGTDPESALAFIEQVRHAQHALVIDADGINILAGHKGWIQQIPADAILTPHAGEMLYLGTSGEKASFALLSEAREMARKHRIFIVLKGRFTAICTPMGKTYFNPTGNSGMATAGSGDVLTGIILALLARGYVPLNACRLGVYLHGLAGDIAASRLGEDSVMASDIVAALPEALCSLKKEDATHRDAASCTLYKASTL